MRLPARPVLDPELDARLVERCRAGDSRAWAALVERHERLVYAVARSYRLSPEDLADVFQDVFAALLKGLPRLRDARSLCRWLASTTDRIALATALRRRREDARREPVVTEHDERPDPGEPVGADLDRLEEQALVRLALGGLRARCRELLEALYYRDPAPGYGTISRELGIPVGSIGPTRARCLEQLQRGWEALEGGSGRISATPSPTSAGERGSAPSPPADRPGGARTENREDPE